MCKVSVIDVYKLKKVLVPNEQVVSFQQCSRLYFVNACYNP